MKNEEIAMEQLITAATFTIGWLMNRKGGTPEPAKMLAEALIVCGRGSPMLEKISNTNLVPTEKRIYHKD